MKKAFVLSVNISNTKGTIKTPIENGFFKANYGLLNDAHSGSANEKRQVSLLAKESIDIMMAQTTKKISYGEFAENITTEGIILHKLPLGTRLQIGSTVHQVMQIGKECHKGCAIQQQIGSCIMPSQGIFTKVLVGGFVQAGDEITILED
ncbi:MAG: MOSC domain-containing protein [Bacteroidales bacterium]